MNIYVWSILVLDNLMAISFVFCRHNFSKKINEIMNQRRKENNISQRGYWRSSRLSEDGYVAFKNLFSSTNAAKVIFIVWNKKWILVEWSNFHQLDNAHFTAFHFISKSIICILMACRTLFVWEKHIYNKTKRKSIQNSKKEK